MPILKQVKKYSSFLFIIYFIFIISLGVSYAYFSSTLNVTGVASIDGYLWPEEVLPAVPEKSEDGSQISVNFKSEYLEGDTISESAQNRFQDVEETYDVATSTYTLNITKTYKFGQSFNPDKEIFNLNFTFENYSNVTWLNGEVSNTVESSGNLLENVSGSIDKASLAPGEKVTLNMKFTLTIYGTFMGIQYTDKITYNINYLVDGEIKTTVVIINFV